MSRVLFGFALLFTVVGQVPDAHAQYFGRNKVQYESFDFDVLKTEHFDIMYYPEAKASAEQAARMAERWYTRLSRILDHQLTSRQVVIMYANHPDFEQTNAISGSLDEATGGVTEAFKRRIVLPFAGPLAETDHVLGHELVHAFQYDITGQGRSAANPAAAGLFRLPLWFVEGMAEYLSLGPVDANTSMWIRDAIDSLPPVRKLDDPRYFPYRWGQAFWSYVGGRWGDEAVGRLLKRAGSTGDLQRAFVRTLGIPDSTLTADWHESLKSHYGSLASQTQKVGQIADSLFVHEGKNDPAYNLAPAISPDGKRLVYLSERDLFSIEMFLADVESKTVIRKIVKTAVDPHFESLQFINSAGGWAPDGERFAIAAVSKGHPVLSLIRVENGNIDREIQFEDLGEIFSPSWSPDGRYIAFSALVGGVMDLYVYDLQESELQRLTNDAFAELQPAWSPDGRTLAFVTDRFSSDLPRLRMGNYRLGLIEFGTGAVRPLPSFSGGKNINPQWSPDGQDLFFLSDQNGISNLYRLNLASGATFQITNVLTGLSGITDLSPALSVATRSGRVAFSLYERNAYSIYTISSPQVLAGQPPRPSFAQVNPAVLPPENRDPGGVVAMLSDATTGLNSAAGFTEENYTPGLSLDYIGQPHLAAGVDSWGTFIGGGASAFWSDMLGNHNLATVLEVNGGYRDITAALAYTNLKQRFNWGLVGQQVPYVTGGIIPGVGTVNGTDAYFETLILQRQTSREVAALAAYAFNRVRRLEFQAGFSHYSFSEEHRTRAWQLDPSGQFVTNIELLDTTITQVSPPALNLGTGSAALVYDNSLFGATSPLLGQRYRLEVSPMLGSLTVINLLADYRRYLIPARPFTIATRIVHRGRYGPDGDSPRLYPMYLGYQTIVRGYPQGSFNAALECPINSQSCPAFDRLLGSRIAVANVELRFPLLGALGIGSGYYGGFPVEMAFFADAGVAWTGSDQLWFMDGTRKPVYSIGAALRLNLLGFAILELDFTRPLSRPEGGWVWQFGFSPGF